MKNRRLYILGRRFLVFHLIFVLMSAILRSRCFVKYELAWSERDYWIRVIKCAIIGFNNYSTSLSLSLSFSFYGRSSKLFCQIDGFLTKEHKYFFLLCKTKNWFSRWANYSHRAYRLQKGATCSRTIFTAQWIEHTKGCVCRIKIQRNNSKWKV